MTERLRELEEIAKTVEVVDTTKAGVDHPVICSFYETLFNVAGKIQPVSFSYKAAQRILDIVEKGSSPDEIDFNDLEEVFHAAGATFERIVIESDLTPPPKTH